MFYPSRLSPDVDLSFFFSVKHPVAYRLYHSTCEIGLDKLVLWSRNCMVGKLIWSTKKASRIGRESGYKTTIDLISLITNFTLMPFRDEYNFTPFPL
jgi:hypothetical protein